jgi:hypothetical protein
MQLSIEESEKEALKREKNYKKNEAGDFICKTCGEEILQTILYHSVWDGPFPMSGSGKVEHSAIPYCPKCEGKPDMTGAPITFK